MAKSVNKVILLGNVGHTPEYKVTRSGMPLAEFNLCTNERTKEGGEWKDKPEWHNCIAFDRLAEVIREYVPKGAKLYVEGRLQTRSWDGKDGTKRHRTEIIVSDVTLLGPKVGDERYAADPEPKEEYAGAF